MRQLLETAGFNKPQEPEIILTQLALSDAFNNPWRDKLLAHMNAPKEMQACFATAIMSSTTFAQPLSSSSFSIKQFLDRLDDAPKSDYPYLWAFLIASTQRFFQDQVVVRLLEQSPYATENKAQILGFADEMGLRQEQHINNPENLQKPVEAIHYGACIGATTTAASGYLKRHKRILDHRTNPSDTYTLFMLCGPRKLNIKLDDPKNTDNIKDDYPHSDTQDYFTHLLTFTNRSLAADKQKTKEQLTEGDMMKERYAHIFGKTIEEAQRVGELKIIERANAELFYKEVAAQLKEHSSPKDSHGAASAEATPSRTIALTSFDVFNRTYERTLQIALEEQGISDITVKCDGGKSAHRESPAAILKELAKQLFIPYRYVAQKLGFGAIDQSLISGTPIKEIQSQCTNIVPFALDQSYLNERRLEQVLARAQVA
jgi:hypothetical protein